MKKFLTIVAMATLALSFGAISMAQDAGPQGGQLQGKRQGRGGGGGVRLMEKIQKDVLATLTLSDVQKSKIADMNKDLISKLKTLRDENKGTEGNKGLGPKVKEIRKAYDNELKDVLGADNWKKYREGMLAKMKEAREKRKDHQESKAGKTPPAF